MKKIPSREELYTLREIDRLTREEIAEKYDVSLSTVKKWIRTLNIPKISKKSKKPAKVGRHGEIIVPIKEDKTILELAQEILGERMKCCRVKGYTLDGFPASIDKIVKAANLEFKNK